MNSRECYINIENATLILKSKNDISIMRFLFMGVAILENERGVAILRNDRRDL